MAKTSLQNTPREDVKALIEEVKKAISNMEEIILCLEKITPGPSISFKGNVTEQTTSILLKLGCSTHLLGYDYVKTAIVMAYEDKRILKSITKKLYPEIAKKYNTEASRVERAIRHAIDKMWERGDLDIQEEIFGNTVDPKKGAPTNSSFIATVVEYLHLLNRE